MTSQAFQSSIVKFCRSLHGYRYYNQLTMIKRNSTFQSRTDGSMDISLTTDQLPEALMRVRQWNLGGTSYLMEDSLRMEMRYSMGADVAVDKWPDFSIILVTPGQNIKGQLIGNLMNFVAKDGVDVKKYLLQAKQLKGRNIQIGNWPLRYEPIYREIADQWKAQLLDSTVVQMYEVDSENLKQYNGTLDDSYTVGELVESDAELVNSLWEFGDDQSIGFARFSINNFPTLAVRTKDGALAAWEVTYFMKALGMLHVMEGHRGHGLAKFLSYTMARKHLDQGIRPYCYIASNNKTSINLHIKLGFYKLEGHDVFYGKLNHSAAHL